MSCHGKIKSFWMHFDDVSLIAVFLVYCSVFLCVAVYLWFTGVCVYLWFIGVCVYLWFIEVCVYLWLPPPLHATNYWGRERNLDIFSFISKYISLQQLNKNSWKQTTNENGVDLSATASKVGQLAWFANFNRIPIFSNQK